MTKVRSMGTYVLAVVVCLVFIVTGCNSSEDNLGAASVAQIDGSTLEPGTPDNPEDSTSPPTPTPNPSPSATPAADPNRITLAVKYVALRSSASETPSPSQTSVETLLVNMSKIWAQCNITFTLGEYLSPIASDHGLDYTPASHTQLDAIRSQFDDHKHALFIKTGTWDRSGTLGNDGSNGFSTLPPDDPIGVVVESQVAISTLLISHEAGHLIGGLGHSTSSTNLMNHYVTTSTTYLTQSQCDYARAKIKQYNATWMR